MNTIVYIPNLNRQSIKTYRNNPLHILVVNSRAPALAHNQLTMKDTFPEILMRDNINEKSTGLSDALFALQKNTINENNASNLTEIYKSAKRLDIRNKILILLYDFDFPLLEAFYEKAFKRERYLDMKLNALRGLSNFITAPAVAKLLVKFNQTLAKRQETTPYNYQEYELLRGKNALPYLVEKYGYDCFKETLEQVNSQYQAMPDAFKNHFTTDENGEGVLLRTPEESKAIFDSFWQASRL